MVIRASFQMIGKQNKDQVEKLKSLGILWDVQKFQRKDNQECHQLLLHWQNI